MTYKQDSIQEADRDEFFNSHYSITEARVTFKKYAVLMFLILVVFMSYDLKAAQCGVAGSSWESNGSTIQTYTLNSDVECLDTVLLTSVEYAVLQERSSSLAGLEELLVTLFAFDAEVFAIVELGLIMAFLTSHYGGRVVRWLGK